MSENVSFFPQMWNKPGRKCGVPGLELSFEQVALERFLERVMFEQKFKESGEENHADIWVQGSLFSRGKSKCNGPKAAAILWLVKMPRWM